MKDLRKIQEFFSKPTEDKIDTIIMDIPLFIRSLEYAREDAKDDMDLHNMAEKAIKGTKQKGILSMVDYDNLTQQKIKEVIQQVISEEKTKRDRCLRIADRKFDKPSAYKSGAVVRCRKGKIWKKLKEIGDIEIARKNITSENLDPTSFKDDNKSSPYGSGYTKIKEDISSKIKTYKIPYKEFNIEIKDRIKEWKNEYGNDTALINEMVARNLLYKIAQDLFGGVDEIDFANKAKNPTNYFQMVMYLGNMILWTSPFIYVDNNHKVITSKTKIKVLDEDYEDLAVLKEDESLHKWFKRQGPSGKEGGWVDCNTCRTTDGKTKCKACGRKKGEKRSKYPSCRPTAAKCKDKGKGKTWGKTK